jgi:hypothetical protein
MKDSVSSATMNQSVCEYLVWPCDPRNDSRVDLDLLDMVPLLISGSTPSTPPTSALERLLSDANRCFDN